MEKEKKKKESIILKKYIPILGKHFKIHELTQEHLKGNTDHDECFIIKQGTVLARDKTGKTFSLEPGNPIGFAEALVSRPYELEYILKEETTVYAFKSSSIRKALATSSSLTRGMIKYSLDRIFNSKKSKTYHLIDDGFLSRQDQRFPMKEFDDDETIFMRNQKPKFFFYVESGKVTLISKLDKVIATYSPGDSFGEMALFTDSVRSATAKSVGKTTVQMVSSEFIKEYFENEDPLIKFSLVCILERLRAMNSLRNLIL
tara:strand:+ start:276 stop:1052 length:777 start_codon:yes stop_codon:yes gene_type:complete